MKFILALLAAVLLAITHSSSAADPSDVAKGIKGMDFKLPHIVPKTIDSINLDAYVGTWYQTHTSMIPLKTYEKDMVCVYAQYFKSDKYHTAFDLVNAGTLGGTAGEFVSADGTAYKTGDPGKYVVNFNDNPMQTGMYWIVALGDIPAGEKQYPWAVVSAPFRTVLFILARDPVQFKAKYEAQVLKLVQEKGFDQTYNKPIPTYQGKDCKYPPLSAPAN